jgi:hypothetical protein
MDDNIAALRALHDWKDFLVLRSEFERLHWAVVDLLNRVQRLEQPPG